MNKDMRYITNMIDFSRRALETFSKVDNDWRRLEKDYDLYNSVLMSLVQLGESANHISSEMKEKYSEVDWNRHRKSRNFYVHVYDGVDPERLSYYLLKTIPRLIEQLQYIQNRG